MTPLAQTTVLLSVEPSVAHEVDSLLRGRLKRRCRRMIAALGLGGVELSVHLADDATVARLNADFRQRRGTTDVLSFGQASPEELDAWLATPQERPQGPERILGDLVISLQVVRRRSRAPAAFEADLVTLLAHGLLHLLGHDHQSSPQRRVMLDLQDRLLAMARARGPVRPLGAPRPP